ncbi:MAG: SRPBCC family protein [Blastocatellia bacterium]|jgi:ligand-binding SRPBCC domain-containing protein
MKTFVLERHQIINRTSSETFDFFSDAFNLERITPPFLRFRIVTTPPIQMEKGRLIDYQLALFGVPFRWRTVIEEWSPETHFVDRQLKGPYRLWHHTHTFEELGPHRILMKDVVRYRIPFGPIGRLAQWLFVGRMLRLIFDYRATATARILNGTPVVECPTSDELARSLPLPAFKEV